MAKLLLPALLLAGMAGTAAAQQTYKPPLHGQHWMAITGKPLAATAGALIFERGGNAVDAACAMLAATATMWDVLSWGGETQALIYDPRSDEVVGINALGVAPTGATPEFFKDKGMEYPPGEGPLAAVTPGTPGGLMTMLAEFGTMSLAEVLAPAVRMADGYPIEAQAARSIARNAETLAQWPYSRAVMLPHADEAAAQASGVNSGAAVSRTADAGTAEPSGAASSGAPEPGEIFRQPDLAATLRKLIEAEAVALERGATREEAIQAAYDRFYTGDIAEEFVRGAREQGALITLEDLADWQVYIEDPVHVSYKGIDVYKLTTWVQGPVMLQMLNMLENYDLESMGYNSVRYIHTLYQVMNLAYADRDFYYGDPYFPPEEPIEGLLSEEYAKARIAEIDPEGNDPTIGPGDPYPFQGETNPFSEYLAAWPPEDEDGAHEAAVGQADGGRQIGAGSLADVGGQTDADREGDAARLARAAHDSAFYRGTTSIQAADEEGWVVSVTPSGGWVPAVIAGRTGIGMSQRAQSFVLDPAENPFNVIAPGKRPRATLTPGMALKDGKPFLSFAVQGGDTQDQNLLQFFLNVVEFGMTVQEAAEAANITSFQMRSSFGDHESEPGRLLLHDATPRWVRGELRDMGYELDFADRTSGPINAIWFDREHGTMWGGSSHHGEDYGIAW